MELITTEPTLSQIPKHLIPTLDEIELLPSVHSFKKRAGKELHKWLENEFKGNINASFLIMSYPRRSVSPHKDLDGRLHGYNYILDTGGQNVITTIYDDSLNIVQQECLLPFTWYKLPTQEWHSVHGIESNQHRIIVSVDYVSDYGLPGRYYYKGFDIVD